MLCWISWNAEVFFQRSHFIVSTCYRGNGNLSKTFGNLPQHQNTLQSVIYRCWCISLANKEPHKPWVIVVRRILRWFFLFVHSKHIASCSLISATQWGSTARSVRNPRTTSTLSHLFVVIFGQVVRELLLCAIKQRISPAKGEKRVRSFASDKLCHWRQCWYVREWESVVLRYGNSWTPFE